MPSFFLGHIWAEKVLSKLLFKNLFIYLLIFGCAGSSLLCGFSLVAVSRGYSSFWCTASRGDGFSWPTLGLPVSIVVAPGLESTGSVVVMYGPSCSMARGILPD